VKDAQVIVATAVGQQRSGNLVLDHIALTKPRLNFLVVASSAAGYYLGALRETAFNVGNHLVKMRALNHRADPRLRIKWIADWPLGESINKSP